MQQPEPEPTFAPSAWGVVIRTFRDLARTRTAILGVCLVACLSIFSVLFGTTTFSSGAASEPGVSVNPAILLLLILASALLQTLMLRRSEDPHAVVPEAAAHVARRFPMVLLVHFLVWMLFAVAVVAPFEAGTGADVALIAGAGLAAVVLAAPMVPLMPGVLTGNRAIDGLGMAWRLTRGRCRKGRLIAVGAGVAAVTPISMVYLLLDMAMALLTGVLRTLVDHAPRSLAAVLGLRSFVPWVFVAACVPAFPVGYVFEAAES